MDGSGENTVTRVGNKAKVKSCLVMTTRKNNCLSAYSSGHHLKDGKGEGPKKSWDECVKENVEAYGLVVNDMLGRRHDATQISKKKTNYTDFI